MICGHDAATWKSKIGTCDYCQYFVPTKRPLSMHERVTRIEKLIIHLNLGVNDDGYSSSNANSQ